MSKNCNQCVDKKIQKLLNLFQSDKRKLFLQCHSLSKEILENDKMREIKEFVEKVDKKLVDYVSHYH